jgi:hypothetical protein
MKIFTPFGTLILSLLLMPIVLQAESDTISELQVATEAPEAPLEKTKEAIHETSDKVVVALGGAQERRAKASTIVLGNYSPIDLLIPGKIGLTVGWIQDVDRTLELEYLRGSISVPFIIEDLGKMTEQRISLIRRSFMGNNSFNFSYGLSYFDFSIHLGDKLLNRLSGGTYPSVDLVDIESVGFNLGLGNRWSFNHNITFGIDWISWAQPMVVTKKQSAFLTYASNSQDRDDVEGGIKFISYFPRLTLLKLQLGILF